MTSFVKEAPWKEEEPKTQVKNRTWGTRGNEPKSTVRSDCATEGGAQDPGTQSVPGATEFKDYEVEGRDRR